MINDFMNDGRDDIIFCLENHRTLIYDVSYPQILYINILSILTFFKGNFDIICDHSGVLDMINDLTSWSGYDKYK